MMHNELEQMFCGKYLGEGIHRKVFVYKPNHDLVIKIAHDSARGRAMNVLEHALWQEIEDEKIARWFAPVVQLSQAGKYLIQDRAYQGPPDRYPKLVPHFFTDLQYGNFGFIGKRLVCMDYGAIVIHQGFHPVRMVKPKWWEAE